MSRSVAGFLILIYACAVSGQQQIHPQQGNPPGDNSLKIGAVNGGNYPDGAFSINYGNENGARIPYSVQVNQKEEDLKRLKATNDSIAVGVVSGANFADGAFSVNANDNGGNRPPPNYGVAGNTQYNGNDRPSNGQGGFAYGNNDGDDSHNAPYYPGNKYNRQTTEAPVSNSASKKGFFSSVRAYVSKWF